MSSVNALKTLSELVFKKALKPSVIITGLSICSLSLPALAQSQASNELNQRQYQIQDFSDDYYAIITPRVSDNEDSESNNTIDIIDAKTKKTLISQSADIDIEYELDNSEALQLGDKISANIVSLPYGEHSVLIYDDFNFDNQKDLALRDGRYGCYGGPSYQVYLKDGDTFVHSDDFTELAQGNCGFFGIDEDAQTLNTMTKSGAAWHQYSEYKVINNKPVAVHIIEEEYNLKGLISILEKIRVNGKMIENQYDQLVMNEEGDDSSRYIYGFDLDNGKKMILDSYDEDHLYYAFADKDGRIELYYDGPFIYDTKQKVLSFTNKPVVYQINKTGITVKLPNKTVLLKSQPKSVQGSLENLEQFGNVDVK